MKSVFLTCTVASTLLGATVFGSAPSTSMQSAYGLIGNLQVTGTGDAIPEVPWSTSEPFENDYISMVSTRWEGWVPLGQNMDGSFGLVAKREVLLNADYLNFSSQRDDYKYTVSDQCEGERVGTNRFLLQAGQRCDIGFNVRPSRQASVVSGSRFQLVDPNDTSRPYEIVGTTIDWRSTVLSYDKEDTVLEETVLGMESFENVRISNISTVRANVSDLGLRWGFSFVDFPTGGFELGPGEYIDLTIRFSPTWAGKRGSFYEGKGAHEGNGNHIESSLFNPTVNYPGAPGADGIAISRIIESSAEDVVFGEVSASSDAIKSSWVTNSSNVPLDFRF